MRASSASTCRSWAGYGFVTLTFGGLGATVLDYGMVLGSTICCRTATSCSMMVLLPLLAEAKPGSHGSR